MIRALYALSLSAVAGFSLACAVAATSGPNEAPSPVYEVIATDSHGESLVAGSGDDCSTAWDSAVLPADWHSVVCLKIAR